MDNYKMIIIITFSRCEITPYTWGLVQKIQGSQPKHISRQKLTIPQNKYENVPWQKILVLVQHYSRAEVVLSVTGNTDPASRSVRRGTKQVSVHKLWSSLHCPINLQQIWFSFSVKIYKYYIVISIHKIFTSRTVVYIKN